MHIFDDCSRKKKPKQTSSLKKKKTNHPHTTTHPPPPTPPLTHPPPPPLRAIKAGSEQALGGSVPGASGWNSGWFSRRGAEWEPTGRRRSHVHGSEKRRE